MNTVLCALQKNNHAIDTQLCIQFWEEIALKEAEDLSI